MKYVVSVNRFLLFKNWHMSQYPVFVIDDSPGAFEEAMRFNTEEQAQRVADNFDGQVKEVAE